MAQVTITEDTKTRVYRASDDAGDGVAMGYKIHVISGTVRVGILPGHDDPETNALTHQIGEGRTEVFRVSRRQPAAHEGGIAEVYVQATGDDATIEHGWVEKVV